MNTYLYFILKYSLFIQIASHLCESLYVMGHCIYRIVDFDDSFAENRFCVRSGICEDLDKCKYKNMSISLVIQYIFLNDGNSFKNQEQKK